MSDGPLEARGREIDGKWTHIGEADLPPNGARALAVAVEVLSSRGFGGLARPPQFSKTQQPDGRRWPDDNQRRVNLYNGLLRKIAAEHPKIAEAVDLGSCLSAGGDLSLIVGGGDVPNPIGIHLTPAGGVFLQLWALPPAGRHHSGRSPGGTPARDRYPTGRMKARSQFGR